MSSCCKTSLPQYSKPPKMTSCKERDQKALRIVDSLIIEGFKRKRKPYYQQTLQPWSRANQDIILVSRRVEWHTTVRIGTIPLNDTNSRKTCEKIKSLKPIYLPFIFLREYCIRTSTKPMICASRYINGTNLLCTFHIANWDRASIDFLKSTAQTTCQTQTCIRKDRWLLVWMSCDLMHERFR